MDEQVAALLLDTLSAAAETRQRSEALLGEVERSGEAALSLARITLASNAQVALRQSAAINLKKYVREHWSIAFDAFQGDPPSHEVKQQVRQAVFHGLSDETRKIRLACASVVSEIAGSDWPDEWPDLLDALVQLLKAGNSTASVHGAMRVMADFVSTDLSEDQLLPLSSTILPELLQILGNEQHSAVTRAQSVAVFNQCLSTLYMVKENHPQAAAYATEHVLPRWIDAFRHILSSDPTAAGSLDSLHIRNEIFQVLCTILISFPKSLQAYTEIFLVDATRHLTALTSIFRSSSLREDGDADVSLETEDGTTLTLPTFLSNILLYILNVSRKGSGKAALVPKGSNEPSEILVQIIYLAIYYGQIMTDDEDRWNSDMNAFVGDEDEEMPASNLRTATLDLVNSFLDNFSAPAIKALAQGVSRMAQEAQQLQSQGQDDWWKGYESTSNHLSSAAQDLGEHIETSKEQQKQPAFDLESVFGSLVVPFLGRQDVPYLQGRALIFASRFAKLLPANLQEQFFHSSLQAFESQGTSFILKICALRALKNFCEEIPDSPGFVNSGDRLTSNLLPFVAQAREATLTLILEALQRTLALGSVQQNQDLCNQLVSALLQPVANGSLKDPILQTTLCDLFRTFSASSTQPVYESLLRNALPHLAQLLQQQPENDDARQQIDSAMIVTNAILDGRPSSFGAGLFGAIAQALFDALSRTGDDSVLQEGIECLTYIVRKDVDQLVHWQDRSGQNGLGALFSVVAMVLQPGRTESASLFVGDLLLHVFRRVGEATLPILPDLLRTLIARLATAQTSTFSQSLILPFAYLMHSQMDTVLDLLESVNVDGKTGVQILLPTWTDIVESILGFWNIRVSTFALSKLLLVNRQSVNSLVVKGDLIVTQANSGVIMTRSRARKNPDQFTQIPLKAKILKIVLKELEQSTEASTVEEVGEGGEDGEDWEDDEPAETAKDLIDLSHFIGGDASFLAGDGDEADEDDDEDLKADPVYSMDMPQHLAGTVRALAGQEKQTFDECVQYLSPAELHTLHSMSPSS